MERSYRKVADQVGLAFRPASYREQLQRNLRSWKVTSSRYPQMRELRTQSSGKPLRTLYAFDPRRYAILLIGGEKTGDDRWNEKFVLAADRLFEKHLLEIEKEGTT